VLFQSRRQGGARHISYPPPTFLTRHTQAPHHFREPGLPPELILTLDRDQRYALGSELERSCRRTLKVTLAAGIQHHLSWPLERCDFLACFRRIGRLPSLTVFWLLGGLC